MVRTAEERKLFFEERNAVLNALSEVQDYDPEEQKDENKKAMTGLVDTLDACPDNLINICGSLAGLTVRQGEVRMGPEKEAPTKLITLKDIRILGAALRNLLKKAEEATPRGQDEKPESTPAVILIRKALSRVAPVQLFYVARYGGVFRYMERSADRNNIGITVEGRRHFGGIPENRLPIKPVPVKKGNMTETIGRIDFGIYPDNAKKIYEILVLLEKEDPIVNLPVKPGGKVISRTINRAGEAQFFLDHLPKGLKPWAEKTEDTGS